MHIKIYLTFQYVFLEKFLDWVISHCVRLPGRNIFFIISVINIKHFISYQKTNQKSSTFLYSFYRCSIKQKTGKDIFLYPRSQFVAHVVKEASLVTWSSLAQLLKIFRNIITYIRCWVYPGRYWSSLGICINSHVQKAFQIHLLSEEGKIQFSDSWTALPAYRFLTKEVQLLVTFDHPSVDNIDKTPVKTIFV